MDESQQINKQKINNLYERALRLIIDFQELIQRDNSVTIHQKNIQALALMMYIKIVNNVGPTIKTFLLFKC